MNKAILIFTLLVLPLFDYAQDKNESNENDFDSRIFVGGKFVPIDYVSGPVIGFELRYKKFGIDLRNDFGLKISKSPGSNYFGISDFRSYNYLSFSYQLFQGSYPFLGVGWISSGDQIYRFNNEYGYSTMTLGWKQKISNRILLELRGDIPLVKVKPWINQNFAFPVGLSIMYNLKN